MMTLVDFDLLADVDGGLRSKIGMTRWQWGELHGERGLWRDPRLLGQNFFAELGWRRGGVEILAAARLHGPVAVQWTAFAPWGEAGVREWVRRECEAPISVLVCPSVDRGLHGAVGRVLVSDDRAAGRDFRFRGGVHLFGGEAADVAGRLVAEAAREPV